MPSPEAWVTTTVKEIRNVPSSVTGLSHVYALVWIGNRRLGRSRRITAEGTFDITAERDTWEHAIAVSSGQSISIRLELWDERGDEPGQRIANINGAVNSPWTPGEREIGGGPTLVIDVDTLRARHGTGTGLTRRSPGPTNVSATLRIRRAATLEFMEIQGLYQPGHNPGPIPGRPRRLAEYNPGYTSDDNQGRIYINRDLSGDWHADTQLIQLKVHVTLLSATLPGGTKVKWTVMDPDDPSNDHTNVHQQWGRYYDPDDYDASGTHIGAHSGDNVRQYQEDGAGTLDDLLDRRPPWEAVSGYALSDASDTEAKTTIDTSTLTSEVKLHCPNVGGTNLIVKAELDPPPTFPVVPTQTGIMTMWKRIDVEMACMHGAFSLSSLVSGIPAVYEAACVQLDFHPETSALADNSTESPDFMSASSSTLSADSLAWTDRVFSHRGQPGWFFLASAKRAYNPTGPRRPPLFDSNDPGTSYTIHQRASIALGSSTFHCEYIEVNDVITDAIEAVRLIWDVTDGTRTEEFRLNLRAVASRRTASVTRIYLLGHDLTSGFTGHDTNGSGTHAYNTRKYFFPRGVYDTQSSSWSGNGYNVPAIARCQVLARRPGETTGISPRVTRGTEKIFAGRTIVFSHFPGYVSGSGPSGRFNSDVPGTVAHELAHAFGMPHKCGYWNDRTPHGLPNGHSCCMNYWSHWLLRPGHTDQLQPLTNDKMDERLCGRHAMEIRRVHLEDNDGLDWNTP